MGEESSNKITKRKHSSSGAETDSNHKMAKIEKQKKKLTESDFLPRGPGYTYPLPDSYDANKISESKVWCSGCGGIHKTGIHDLEGDKFHSKTPHWIRRKYLNFDKKDKETL